MDLSVIAEAFVVTVVGGLGSIPGAFVASLLIGLVKALCIGLGQVNVGGLVIAFPKLTLVAEFVVMAVVLAFKPYGLLGTAIAAPPTTSIAEHRALVRPPGRRTLFAALVALVVAALLPAVGDEYDLVLATDVLILALFAASLQFMMSIGGLASFGHAAYFGLGAYAAALAVKHGVGMGAAMAFAHVVWSIAFQWDSVTGGSNGLVGIWPPPWLGSKRIYFYFTLGIVGIALTAIAWI